MSASQTPSMQDETACLQPVQSANNSQNIHSLRLANGLAAPIRITHHPKAVG